MNKRILIAGTHSGCGKTTVTLALLSALKVKNIPLAAFKCGPDYIDPLFHREVLGLAGGTLDPYFQSPCLLRQSLSRYPQKLSVIEGVMGYYDGVGMEGLYSTYSVASASATPVILVVNVRGMYTSAGAILQGFTGFRPQSGIRGVIFNGASAMLYEGLKELAKEAGLIPLGFLPSNKELSIGSRHLGLLRTQEVEDLSRKLRLLGELALETIDIEGILRIAGSAPPIEERQVKSEDSFPVHVAIARDEAFCFLYEENLELKREMGAELTFFSPIRDRALPEKIDLLYLPGGYPELHIEELSKNDSMRESIRSAAQKGLPLFAEGGGFVYLHSSFEGKKLCGVIKGDVTIADRLQRFGYQELMAKNDNLLCRAGEAIRCHEFHYYSSEGAGESFISKKPSGTSWPSAHGSSVMYAGFPQIYFPAQPHILKNILARALDFQKERKTYD